ncbi:MAG: hypothetical protein ACI9YU_001515 [Flavobacteriales bacterium]|jgi:hypothetical protein
MRNVLMAAFAVLAITGCNSCYNVECDEPDTARIDGLKFVFDIEHSYSSSQVDSAYILLFNKGDWNDPIATFSFAEEIKESEDGSFMLKAGYPFSQVENLLDWNYVIFPNNGETVYRISNVNSEGFYPTDCCCCYRNKLKTFRLNNSDIERSGSEEAVVLNR